LSVHKFGSPKLISTAREHSSFGRRIHIVPSLYSLCGCALSAVTPPIATMQLHFLQIPRCR
jgi:hypothetical protein